jgi:hypothetical protein
MPCFTQSSSAGFCGTWEKSVRLCTSLIKFSSTNLLICPKTVEVAKSRFFIISGIDLVGSVESIQSYLAICKQLEYGKTDINEEQ